jgi:aminocarboxymuconate-semialdehyde decarboxylase
MNQRTVDCHNHYFPPEYLAFLLDRAGESVRAEKTGPHSFVCKSGAAIVGHIDRPGHYDLKARIEDLDAAGMDTQIISLTIPGPELLDRDQGVYWAKKINDALASAVREYPGRFFAYASLPYQDPDEACRELERCHKELGVKGVMMFSNFRGEPMFERRFEPLFALAGEYGLPILLHPALPMTASVMDKNRIPYQLYGYILDSTLCVISLIFSGVFQRNKKFKLIHAHLGGIAPYLVRRLQDSWKGYAKEWGLELDEMPDETYRTRVYPDTTSFYLPAMKCCLEWVGPEHMVLGTDYAHRVGDPEGAIRSVKQMGEEVALSQETINLILGKNAERMFHLAPRPSAVRGSV